MVDRPSAACLCLLPTVCAGTVSLVAVLPCLWWQFRHVIFVHLPCHFCSLANTRYFVLLPFQTPTLVQLHWIHPTSAVNLVQVPRLLQLQRTIFCKNSSLVPTSTKSKNLSCNHANSYAERNSSSTRKSKPKRTPRARKNAARPHRTRDDRTRILSKVPIETSN